MRVWPFPEAQLHRVCMRLASIWWTRLLRPGYAAGQPSTGNRKSEVIDKDGIVISDAVGIAGISADFIKTYTVWHSKREKTSEMSWMRLWCH